MAKPGIYITRTAWDQIMAAVLYQDLEVQWFARGEYLPTEDERGFYIMYEICIPPQEVQGAFTDTGENEANIESLNFVVTEAIRLGKPIEGWGNWGHSHVKMGTTPSGTDWKSMGELAKMWGHALGIVVNQNGEVTGYGVGPHPLFADMFVEMRNVTVAVEPLAVPEVQQVTEWMQNVTKKTYTQSGFQNMATAVCTKVEEVINSDDDPTEGDGFVFLAASDYNGIKDIPNYEEEQDRVWDKYVSQGWKALTPWERKLVLPDLESATWAKRRQSAFASISSYGAYDSEEYWGQYE